MRRIYGATWLMAAFAAQLAVPTTAQAATATASGRAIIITPFQFIQVDDLAFGTIVPGPSTGTVTLDAMSGGRSTSGGVVALGGAGQRARFVGAGSDGQTVDVSLSAPPTLDDGNGNTMTMASLDLDGPTTRTIGPDLAFDVYVGGTLNIGANQTPGTYSGTFSLTVQYN
jgi:hypothetical protein